MDVYVWVNAYSNPDPSIQVGDDPGPPYFLFFYSSSVSLCNML